MVLMVANVAGVSGDIRDDRECSEATRMPDDHIYTRRTLSPRTAKKVVGKPFWEAYATTSCHRRHGCNGIGMASLMVRYNLPENELTLFGTRLDSISLFSAACGC